MYMTYGYRNHDICLTLQPTYLKSFEGLVESAQQVLIKKNSLYTPKEGIEPKIIALKIQWYNQFLIDKLCMAYVGIEPRYSRC